MHSITFLKFYAFGIQMKSRSCGNGSGEAAGPAAEMISVDSWKGGHMGEKDMAEKLLEDYPDVFADIVNVLLFDGKQEVRSEELAQSGLRSQFKADSGRMHEEERDVAKYWMKNGRIAALIGLENQTEADGDMPMRLIAYDGSSYKSQILKRNKGERYPVITLVLHFGEGRWKSLKRSLRDMFLIPLGLRSCFENYQMHLYEIAYLTERQLKMFRSDFGIIAEYIVRKRKNEPFRLSQDREIQHVDAFMKMLLVFAEEPYIEELTEEILNKRKKGERITMCDISKAWVDLGRGKGLKEGEVKGQEKMGRLITLMIRDGRIEELGEAGSDRALQNKLMKEYGIQDTASK